MNPTNLLNGHCELKVTLPPEILATLQQGLHKAYLDGFVAGCTVTALALLFLFLTYQHRSPS